MHRPLARLGLAALVLLAWQPAAAERPRAIYLSADNCPACREFESLTLADPWMDSLRARFDWRGVNVDLDPEPARRYRVDSVPMVILLGADGAEQARFAGPVPLLELSQAMADMITARVPVAGPPGASRMAGSVLPTAFRLRERCASNSGFGPFRVDPQSTLQALRLGLIPRGPSTMAAGQGDLHLGLTVVNEWAAQDSAGVPDGDPGAYLVDYEAVQLSALARIGLGSRMEVELSLHQRHRGGGRLDAAVDAFHDLFSLPDNGRAFGPRDGFAIALDPDNAPAIELAPGDYARDATLALRRQLSCGDARWPAVTVTVTTRLRTHDHNELAGGDLDSGLALELGRRVGPVFVYANLSWVRFGADRLGPIRLRDSQLAFLLAGEWRFFPRHALLFQWLASQGAAREFSTFSDPAHELVFGWRGQIGRHFALEVAGMENFVNLNNSPDIGGHLALSWRW